MVLVDKRILGGGISMVVVGIAISLFLNTAMPLGEPGMTEEERTNLLMKQRQNQDMNTLAGILIGIGFMLVLISFGARRRRGGAKKVEKKPAE